MIVTLEVLNGYIFRAAQVLDNDIFFFIVEEKPPVGWEPGTDPETSAFALCYNVRLGQWSQKKLSHDVGTLATATGPFSESGQSTIFFATPNVGEQLARIIYTLSYDDNFSLTQPELISNEQIRRVGDATYIDDKLYISGNEQTVLRRIAKGQYERISHKPGGRSVRKHEDWAAIDGFSETDIYTTGKDRGEGSVFHYDGTEWRAMVLDPEIGKFNGRAIFCMPDGYVIAVSQSGQVVRGRRGEVFETLVNPEPLLAPIVIDSKSVAWFKGKLYMSTLDWLFVMENGAWQPVKSEHGFQPISFKGLATNGEVLLQYGEYGASFYDGKTWYKVYAPVVLEDLVRAEKLEQQLDKLSEGVDIMRRLRSRIGE